MGFKGQVAEDIRNVFLCTDEFAEPRTVKYDGVTYADIPVVSGAVQLRPRPKSKSTGDRAQGLYVAGTILYVALDDIGGVQPEQGARIHVSALDNPIYLHSYCIASSDCDMGMVRLVLSGVEE